MCMSGSIDAVTYFQAKLDFTTGPVGLAHKIEAGEVNVVDVRDAESFAAGHIPGAVNLPEEKWESAEGITREKDNVFYCYSAQCHLAAKAALWFARKGFHVMEMDGGWPAWEAHGMSRAS